MIVKIGPIQNSQGKSISLPKLIQSQVLFSNNGSPLNNGDSKNGYPIDIHGIYTVKVPASYSNPGDLCVIVNVDGWPTFRQDFVIKTPVENVQAIVDENTKTFLEALALVEKNFDLSFAEFCKEIKKQNMLDEVSKEFDTIRDNQSKLSLHLTSIEKIVKANKPIEVDIKPDLEPLKGLLSSIKNESRMIKKAISEIKLDVDVKTPVNAAVAGLAKNSEMVTISDRIGKLSDAVEAIKPQKVDVFAPFGGKPLSLKDGCVLLSEGDGKGQIKLRDGEVIVAELKDKQDMVLARDGMRDVTKKVMADIVKELKRITSTSKPKARHH